MICRKFSKIIVFVRKYSINKSEKVIFKVERILNVHWIPLNVHFKIIGREKEVFFVFFFNKIYFHWIKLKIKERKMQRVIK